MHPGLTAAAPQTALYQQPPAPQPSRLTTALHPTVWQPQPRAAAMCVQCLLHHSTSTISSISISTSRCHGARDGLVLPPPPASTTLSATGCQQLWDGAVHGRALTRAWLKDCRVFRAPLLPRMQVGAGCDNAAVLRHVLVGEKGVLPKDKSDHAERKRPRRHQHHHQRPRPPRRHRRRQQEGVAGPRATSSSSSGSSGSSSGSSSLTSDSS